MKIYNDFPLQDPPKFTQIGIFGLKICHLATLYYNAPALKHFPTLCLLHLTLVPGSSGNS
jgi:hypothetical protein